MVTGHTLKEVFEKVNAKFICAESTPAAESIRPNLRRDGLKFYH